MNNLPRQISNRCLASTMDLYTWGSWFHYVDGLTEWSQGMLFLSPLESFGYVWDIWMAHMYRTAVERLWISLVNTWSFIHTCLTKHANEVPNRDIGCKAMYTTYFNSLGHSNLILVLRAPEAGNEPFWNLKKSWKMCCFLKFILLF